MDLTQKLLFLCALIFTNNCSKIQADPVDQGKFDRVSDAISSLGSSLLGQLYSESQEKENWLISPASIYEALSLVHLASGGKTWKELSNILTIPTDNYSKESTHSSIGTFYDFITKPTLNKDSVTLNIADALFASKGLTIKQNYLDLVKRYYQSTIETVDFKAKKETIEKINGWVSNKTNGRIRDAVDETLGPETEALIVSSLYFTGQWAEVFHRGDTKMEKFSTGKKEVDVSMMNLLEEFPYINKTDLQFEAINLPYVNSSYAMNIILPYPTQTIKNAIQSLKNLSLKELMKEAKTVKIDLKLPKVKFANKASLVKPLQQLGLQELFSAASNLTELSELPLRVSEISHSAEIEIREEGTTASSATIVQIVPGATFSVITPFHVNRPFIVHIYSRTFGTVLFSGVVQNPASSN